MAGQRDDAAVRVLLTRYGHSCAQEAGIRLRDTPVPLYQLPGLANPLSARIPGEIAVAATLVRGSHRDRAREVTAAASG